MVAGAFVSSAQVSQPPPAHERYEGLTKADLVEELGRRELPKSGNVEDLIERLIDADTQ